MKTYPEPTLHFRNLKFFDNVLESIRDITNFISQETPQ